MPGARWRQSAIRGAARFAFPAGRAAGHPCNADFSLFRRDLPFDPGLIQRKKLGCFHVNLPVSVLH
jgi:hypothetical protein